MSGEIVYRPIGVIHTPWRDAAGAPIQPPGARDAPGRAEMDPDLAEGLKDLEGFSHLILVYHFHRAGPARLTVTPFLDDAARGVFATRAPVRPNPLGISLVRLSAVEGSTLHLLDVDMLDGTPLIDLKPYVPEFDAPAGPVRTGWLAKGAAGSRARRGDDRFKS